MNLKSLSGIFCSPMFGSLFGTLRKTCMKKIIVFLASLSILLSGMNSSLAQQTVSDEAKRHFDRGMAAVEMAKSAGDYGNAIEEF